MLAMDAMRSGGADCRRGLSLRRPTGWRSPCPPTNRRKRLSAKVSEAARTRRTRHTSRLGDASHRGRAGDPVTRRVTMRVQRSALGMRTFRTRQASRCTTRTIRKDRGGSGLRRRGGPRRV